MTSALVEIASGTTSIREASRKYGIPRGTIQDRVHNRVEDGTCPCRQPKLCKDDETKLMDYASNRACMGIGFSKTNFLRYAADLASKRGKPFKNPIPTGKWWKGIKKEQVT
ncbi:uncharacterized protein LOC117316197 [Pecten maximus]|uniref:uncharacterized protein LOC117316197 n=1 Tax=Pecten maximus TaxID=6579 RepID=UPI001458E20F|nr:uncharacterized protein LOC117316197 [Pecten maximus]